MARRAKYRGLSATAAKAPPSVEMTDFLREKKAAMMKRWFPAVAMLVLVPVAMVAQRPKKSADNQSGYDRAARATVLHTANVYVTADAGSPPITTVGVGHEVVVSSRNGPWVNVFANTDAKEDADPDSKPEFEDAGANPDPSSGWIRDKGIVGPGTPNGDALIYGAAVELEAQAMQPHSPKGAAEAAHRLYLRVGEYFPDSPLAAEAAFRAADIRWQLEKADISTLPSAREQDASLRPQIYEGELKRVMKWYGDTPFAARAAFDLLDNKVCGDWQGLPHCPEMETQLYVKYAERYKGGPKSAEALWDAAYRQGVLVTMYKLDEQGKMADGAVRNCQAIAEELRRDYPGSDYAARALSLAFRVRQGIPATGSDRD